jgi:hypothetical protein
MNGNDSERSYMWLLDVSLSELPLKNVKRPRAQRVPKERIHHDVV